MFCSRKSLVLILVSLIFVLPVFLQIHRFFPNQTSGEFVDEEGNHVNYFGSMSSIGQTSRRKVSYSSIDLETCEELTGSFGDWGDLMCPVGKVLLSGGCHAVTPPHFFSCSTPIKDGNDRVGWKCGGHLTNKEIHITCCGKVDLSHLIEMGIRVQFSEYTVCNGINSTDPSVCNNGKGLCLRTKDSYGACFCSNGYDGENCDRSSNFQSFDGVLLGAGSVAGVSTVCFTFVFNLVCLLLLGGCTCVTGVLCGLGNCVVNSPSFPDNPLKKFFARDNTNNQRGGANQRERGDDGSEELVDLAENNHGESRGSERNQFNISINQLVCNVQEEEKYQN